MKLATQIPLPIARVSAGIRAHRWRADALAITVLLLLASAAVLLAYRAPTVSRIDLGTTYAEPYLNRFTKPETNADYTYAFSTDGAVMRLPGVGAGLHMVSLRMNGWRPDGAPSQLTLRDGERTLGSFIVRQQPATYRLLVPSDGDITLHWSSTTFVPGGLDTRRVGMVVDWAEAQPLAVGVAPSQMLNLLLIALLGYLLLRRLALRPHEALALAAGVALMLAGLLAFERIWWTNYTFRLAALLMGLHLALWPARTLTRWAWRRGGVALTPAGEIWLWRILMLAALIKIGGVIYPHIIVYDQSWHVPRTQLVLGGRFMELIVPSRVTLLGETVGLEGGHFPYSPLWYLITAPFGLLGADIGIASNVLNAALDVSRSLLIGYIALRMFGGQRAALLAAGIYHLLPMPYFLLSWGNWPTQLGLWGALLLIAVVVATFERPRDRATLALLTVAALLAMLTYTVVGIISFTMIGMLAALEWLRRSDEFGRLRARTLLGALVASEVIAFAIYHIWYVPTMITETAPALIRALTSEQRTLHNAPKPGLLGDLAVNGSYALNHLTWLGLGFLPAGAIIAWRQARGARSLLAAWGLTLAFFSLFSWAVADMILKHIFFMLPLVAICIALVQSALWSRGAWAARLTAIITLLYLAAVSADRWYGYIMLKRH